MSVPSMAHTRHLMARAWRTKVRLHKPAPLRTPWERGVTTRAGAGDHVASDATGGALVQFNGNVFAFWNHHLCHL